MQQLHIRKIGTGRPGPGRSDDLQGHAAQTIRHYSTAKWANTGTGFKPMAYC